LRQVRKKRRPWKSLSNYKRSDLEKKYKEHETYLAKFIRTAKRKMEKSSCP
jgi:hypothetical protein